MMTMALHALICRIEKRCQQQWQYHVDNHREL